MTLSAVSAIITTYNDAHLLGRAIDSVLSQSDLPEELIVVDDGSDNDDARSVVADRARKSEGVVLRFFRKINGGPSSARNLALQVASNEYIAFLDADDEMLRDCIRTRRAALTSLPSRYFGVYGSAIRSDGKKLHYMDFDGVPPADAVGRFSTGLPGGSCLYMFRRSALLEVGGFDEELINNEDFDLLLRLGQRGLKCKGSLGPGTLVHVRAGSVSRTSDPRKVFENAWRFLEKAEKQRYFSRAELGERQKAAYLTLARRVMLAEPRAGGQALKHAFQHSPPRRAKEWAAFLISRLV